MKKIRKAGVIGAGTMGSALAQKFSQEGFLVVLADKDPAALERARRGIAKMLEEGVEKKVFSAEQRDRTLAAIELTSDLKKLASCDVIIEAVFENYKVKTELLAELSQWIPADTILATNTSSFSVSELAKFVKCPERFIGLHYFYHAAKNRLVEIIPGKETSSDTIAAIHRFAVLSGKDPIYTADVYGFAVNRFFVPWLNESVRLLDDVGFAPAVIDAVGMKILGIGMGPFALMNATGVPIALHAQRTLSVFGPSYTPARLLVEQVANKENWNMEVLPGSMTDEEESLLIKERMLGCIFFVCSRILNDKICTATDLNKGAKIGLRWKFGPVDLMKKYGLEEVRRLASRYASLYNEPIPLINETDWNMEFVQLTKHGTSALIQMNRPEDLNALNEEVIRQLENKFNLAEQDPDIRTIYITGSGKAFIAGADIKYFIKNIQSHTIDNIINFTRYAQAVFDTIDHSSKTVVALVNGLALGGGLELALCADVILVTPKAVMAFPETGIGIYPGLGGTQRSSLRIGRALAKYLVLTGKMLHSRDAVVIGLADGEVSLEEMLDLPFRNEVPVRNTTHQMDQKWARIQSLFENNSYKSILKGSPIGFSEEETRSIVTAMRYKAPIAMQIADELIEQAKGPASELEKLSEIFNTSDALLGLTSIGKKVSYTGK